jgi:homopolymeric O-antigen transport system ATP-binding protein
MSEAGVSARELGISFDFDVQSRVVTPIHARLLRRVTETWGLRNVNFEIGPGEGVALLGPSGSGKTTLLRALGRVLSPDEGELEARGRVGAMLSIDAGLISSLTGRENAMLIGVLAGLSRNQARDSLERVREASRLGDAFERTASSYSQGMRARLAFTAVSEIDPDIVLLDEVHEAFDHSFRARLAERVKACLDRGGIAIAAGHDHEILGGICERALLLADGRVIDDGPFEEVRRRYRDSDDAH